MISTSVGIISVISTNANTTHLPGNRKYTNARPLSSEKIVLMTVIPIVMITLLIMYVCR